MTNQYQTQEAIQYRLDFLETKRDQLKKEIAAVCGEALLTLNPQDRPKLNTKCDELFAELDKTVQEIEKLEIALPSRIKPDKNKLNDFTNIPSCKGITIRFISIYIIFIIGAVTMFWVVSGRDFNLQVADITLISSTLTTTSTPALTARPMSILTLSPFEEALNLARAGVTHNADWQPFVHDFGDGVEMVLVPKGCFTMGSTESQINYAIIMLGINRNLLDNEQPATEICFDESFWIDETEVTQLDFDLLNGKKANSNYFEGENLPVEQINWSEAQAFCIARDGRLPTEAEWEYAARGPDNLIYPWGNEFVAENVVYSENSNYQTMTVKSHPVGVSWVGAFDLIGNLWEWTLSEYRSYPYIKDDGRNYPITNTIRVLRGGSVGSDESYLRVTSRHNWYPNDIGSHVGFRCARFD